MTAESPRRPDRQTGFTLIELMITVAIVAILAAVALPSYTEHVRKARRGDAQAFMSEVAARQQHFLIDRRAYASDITTATSAGGLGMTIPSDVSTYYNVTSAVINAPLGFVVTAAPIGAQQQDTCGQLTLSNTGARTPSGRCW